MADKPTGPMVVYEGGRDVPKDAIDGQLELLGTQARRDAEVQASPGITGLFARAMKQATR